MADGARAQRQTGLQTPQLQGDEESETTLQWIKTMTLWKINMLTIVFFFFIFVYWDFIRLWDVGFFLESPAGLGFGKLPVCVVWSRSDQKTNMTEGFTPSWQHPHCAATTSGLFGYASPHVKVKMQPEKINTEPHSSRQNTLCVLLQLRRVGRERTTQFKNKF